MTAPRRIPRKKTIFLVTRRVNDRRFLLRPDAALTNLVTWMLGVLAPVFGIEVHAATVLSTHYHLVLSVANQRISPFFEQLNALLAKGVNVLRGARRGIVWEPGGLSLVELKTLEAIVESIAYTVVQAIEAGLVWRPEDWPGLCVQVEDLGRSTFPATRPDVFFDPKVWAEHAVLEVTLPEPLVIVYGEDGARALIATEVERLIEEAHAKIKASYGKVLGPVAARNASPFARATTWEDFGGLKPTYKTGRGPHEERIEAAREVAVFRQKYREEWLRYRAGERDLVFPHGTYLMRVRHGVRVEEAPP